MLLTYTLGRNLFNISADARLSKKPKIAPIMHNIALFGFNLYSDAYAGSKV